jgi:hypothetical protein
MTTSLLFVGPAAVGPFGDADLWRVGPSCGLVEGGTNGPYFLMNGGQVNEYAMMVDGLDVDTALRAVILVLAVLSQNENAHYLLTESHNLVETSTGLQVAPCWDLADDVANQLVQILAASCRVGLVQLDRQPLISEAVLAELSRLGFAVTVFRSNHQDAA